MLQSCNFILLPKNTWIATTSPAVYIQVATACGFLNILPANLKRSYVIIKRNLFLALFSLAVVVHTRGGCKVVPSLRQNLLHMTQALYHCAAAHLDPYPMDTWGWSGSGVKLTTHLHLVPRSKMRGAIPPLHEISGARATEATRLFTLERYPVWNPARKRL
jgi:hypothetical protein